MTVFPFWPFDNIHIFWRLCRQFNFFWPLSCHHNKVKSKKKSRKIWEIFPAACNNNSGRTNKLHNNNKIFYFHISRFRMTKNNRNFPPFAVDHKKVFPFLASRCSKCRKSDKRTTTGATGVYGHSMNAGVNLALSSSVLPTSEALPRTWPHLRAANGATRNRLGICTALTAQSLQHFGKTQNLKDNDTMFEF